jgi:ferredoxin-type protein NapF
MNAVISRRDFLRGDLRKVSIPIRPPWALDDAAFVSGCTRCLACAMACPQEIIVGGAGGFPEVDFLRGECTFCGDCVPACEAGVLSRAQWVAEASPWEVRTVVNRSCFNHHGVFCRVCADRCICGAIRFQPVRGGAFLPRVDDGRCTGCGACIAACPAAALRAERRAGPSDQAEKQEESGT